jgi:hypothetical protein
MGGMPGDGGMDQPLSHRPKASSDLKSLTKKLKLNDDQQAQIKTILTDRDQQITALVKQAAGARSAESSDSSKGTTTSGTQLSTPEQTMAIFIEQRSICESANSKIEEILTAGQMKNFQSWEKNQEKAQMEDGVVPPVMGGGPDGGPGGQM